ncbi:MAG: hypothetical protein ACD_44C00190G0002 [uncultured bacterium]|nr:MAG: hypothetical protein ACD_44C00190G0002 [uncultured bacterium]
MTNTIPREFIDLLLSRIELVDLIDHRVPLRKKSSNNYFACCPFHTEKSASFSVSQKKQFYYCFGCGAHGNAIDFLMKYDRLSFPEAIEALAKEAQLEIPRSSYVETKPIPADSYELLQKITQFYQQQLKISPPAIAYLKERGLSGEIAKQFAIGFAPPGWDHILQTFGKTPDDKQKLSELGMLIKKEEGGHYDRFRERIMFPIHDRRGRIVGFGGRIIDKGEPKYLNSPETPIFQKGRELYGLYEAQQTHQELSRVLIVEGYMDVIALFQHGITYAVATLGTATTSHHIQRLARYTSHLIFCFDGDTAGRTAAWRALLVILPLMQDGLQIHFMFLPDNEDPDSLIRKIGKENFEKKMEEAHPLSHFFFQSLALETDLSNKDGRARFVKLAKEHIDQLPEGIFQQMMLEELAKRARITDIKQLKPAHSQRPHSLKQKARPPSALRLAMTLLTQEPTLAELIEPALPEVNLPGFSLLHEVIAIAKYSKNLTTGALLEHWRDRDERKTLEKLAHAEHLIPDEGIQQEFLGLIQCLRKLGQQAAIDKLLAKANQAELSEEEKQELRSLQKEKALL